MTENETSVVVAANLYFLREALRGRYGRHSGLCEVTRSGDSPPCTCGLDAVLKADGGGDDALEWLTEAIRLAMVDVGVGRAGGTRQEAMDRAYAALASPPALPGADEAMAAFARRVVADVEQRAEEYIGSRPVVSQGALATMLRHILGWLDPAELVRRRPGGEGR